MTEKNGWDDADDEIVTPHIVRPLLPGATNAEIVDKLSQQLLVEITRVSEGGKCDVEAARQNAALALQLQMELANFLADAEGRARACKNNIKFVEALVASDIRNKAEKKITDAAVKEKCAIDSRLQEAEKLAIDSEVEAKKWAYIFGTAKDGHIFFRNIANGKNEW